MNFKMQNVKVQSRDECAQCMCVCVFTFGRVSMVAGAISVSSMSCFSMALFFVGVELFLFFRDGDGVPSSIQAETKIKEKFHLKRM